MTVCTTKCGRPEYRYDIRKKAYVCVCNCGLYRLMGTKHDAADLVKSHGGGWRILTWRS